MTLAIQHIMQTIQLYTLMPRSLERSLVRLYLRSTWSSDESDGDG